MDNLVGLLRIKVKKGTNLAIRDFRTSDPYCVFITGDQRLKTHIVDRDLNPVWNEDLTLPIEDPEIPVKLMVMDHDIFTRDDEMGDAEFNIKPFFEAHKANPKESTISEGTVLSKIEPDGSNCLSEESSITWQNGEVVQHLLLKLRNVESGEIEIELHWIDIPGT